MRALPLPPSQDADRDYRASDSSRSSISSLCTASRPGTLTDQCPLPGRHLPSKSRIKRFAPKTRSGCVTCRTRHIKCDEAKPECRRCTKAGLTCYYAPDLTRHFEPGRGDSTSPACSESFSGNGGRGNDVRMLQAVQPNYGTAEEKHYLHEFLNFSTPWFTRYFRGGFFFTLLPQRSWSHPALKHSLVALAIACEDARRLSSRSHSMTGRRYYQARHGYHYAQALKHIYTMSEPDEDVVLITSAVFWMHDNVVHNSRTAMVHLQGFLRILTERKLRKGGTWQGDWENTLLTGLVFSADSVDDALAETLLPDLMHSIRQRLDDSTYLRSFNNISAAWEELRIGLAAIPYSVCRTWSHASDGSNHDRLVSTSELRAYFSRWYRAFSSVLDIGEADRILLECHYVCVLLSLEWAEYGLREHNVTFPQSEARMEHVLSLVETLDVSSVAQAPLGKDLALPILPVVTHVWSVPTSMELRRRFFRVLRALHRIEGLWSSDVVADTVATAYSMEEGTDARTNQHPTELVHRGLRARNDMYLAGMNEDEAAYMGVWMPADSRAITHQNIPGITGITNPATLEGQVEKTVRNYRLGGGLANGSYLFDEALSIGNATR